MEGLGKHYLAEYYGCSRSVIDDTDRLRYIMSRAVELSKANFIKAFFHRFSPQGVSGVVIIAESHIAIHTWPEHDYAAVDLFSCGDFDFSAAFDYIKKEIQARKFSFSVVERGILPGKGGEPVPLELKKIDSGL